METNLKRFLEAPGKQIACYIAGGAATVVMAAVICCNLLLIVSNIREPNQMPSVLGVRPAIVLSGSMSPTFEAGDVILLKKAKGADELEVGDVACYLYSGKATTHRIIERFEAEGKPRYIMKGDYNNVEDRLAVDPEQIQGVWTGGRIRHLGKFLMFLQSTMGMFVFLICPLAGLLGWDIIKRRRADRLRMERLAGGESAESGYGEDREAAGWGRIGALRGILGYTSREEKRQGDLAYQQRDPAGMRETRGDYEEDGRRDSYTEADRRRRPSDHTRTTRYVNEYRLSSCQEDEIPRRARRRPPVQERKGKREFYRQGDIREPRQSWESREQAAGRMDSGFGSHTDRDDEFYYYSQLDDEMDYYQELEEAAEHYRRMKDSLTRYRRMEAVINRCRRLEEALSRYEALAERLENYERLGDYERSGGYERPGDYKRLSGYERPGDGERSSGYECSGDCESPSGFERSEDYERPSGYESLGDYERQNVRERQNQSDRQNRNDSQNQSDRQNRNDRQNQSDRQDRNDSQNRSDRQNRETDQEGNIAAGVTNRGTRREAPIDHIERPGGTTPPTVE